VRVRAGVCVYICVARAHTLSNKANGTNSANPIKAIESVLLTKIGGLEGGEGG